MTSFSVLDEGRVRVWTAVTEFPKLSPEREGRKKGSYGENQRPEARWHQVRVQFDLKMVCNSKLLPAGKVNR